MSTEAVDLAIRNIVFGLTGKGLWDNTSFTDKEVRDIIKATHDIILEEFGDQDLDDAKAFYNFDSLNDLAYDAGYNDAIDKIKAGFHDDIELSYKMILNWLKRRLIHLIQYPY